MTRAYLFRILSIAGLAVLPAIPQYAAEVRHLSLSDAVHLAISQNRALKIARWKVAENEQKRAGARSGYFPQITNHSSLLRTTAEENITIPAGAFGVTPIAGLIPASDLLLNQGGKTLVSSGTTVLQPLTQLIRIREGNRIAASEVASSRVEVRKGENEVALQVHALYYNILITRLHKKAAEEDNVSASTRLRESEGDVRNGSALRATAMEARAGLLESEQTVLTATLRLSDLTTELNDLLGLPLDTALELDGVESASFQPSTREEYLRDAWAGNPQIHAAEESVRQATAGVTAAKTAYIPDVTLFARHSYQNGVPFLVHNFGTVGVNLSYDVFDFGKRRAAVREREAKVAQAQENLERLKEAMSVQIERGYNKLAQTRHMVQVAAEVAALRQENERISGNQLAQGVVLVSAQRKATASSYKAEADLLQAELSYLLAHADLEQLAGRTPGR